MSFQISEAYLNAKNNAFYNDSNENHTGIFTDEEIKNIVSGHEYMKNMIYEKVGSTLSSADIEIILLESRGKSRKILFNKMNDLVPIQYRQNFNHLLASEIKSLDRQHWKTLGCTLLAQFIIGSLGLVFKNQLNTNAEYTVIGSIIIITGVGIGKALSIINMQKQLYELIK